MYRSFRSIVRTLTAATLMGSSLLASPGNGWCHLTPWTADAPEVSDFFGWRTELGEGWAFVVNRGERAVQVYRRDGGSFVPTQLLQDPAGLAGEASRFGDSVVIDDGRLFISAPWSDAAGVEAGAVFRYALEGQRWVLAETITSPSPTPGDRFGEQLDVDGHWLAAREISGLGDSRVEVLRHDGAQWLAHATLTHPESVFLGSSLALVGTDDGQYANVFASDSAAYGSTGAVFHFRVHPFGYQWGPVIQAPAPVNDDSYGYSIDCDGEHLVVSASFTQQAGQDTGAAYVYDIDGEVFPPVVGPAVTLLPDANQVGGTFGHDVNVDGGRIAIGAPGTYGNDVARTGAVYVFRPAFFGNGWDREDRLTREGGQHGDRLGSAAALDGELVLAGAPDTGAYLGEAVLFSLASRELDGGLAPSDVLATVEHYGEGKPGALGVPELQITQAPVPGEMSLVGLTKVPQGASPFVLYGVAPAAVAFDEGTLLVAESLVLALPTVGPWQQVGWAWEIPADNGLAGLELFAQAVLVDPAGYGPKQTSQSRGMRVVIGY